VLGPEGPVGVALVLDDELPPQAAEKRMVPAVVRQRRKLDTVVTSIAIGAPVGRGRVQRFACENRQRAVVRIPLEGWNPVPVEDSSKLTFLSMRLTVLRTKPVGSIGDGAPEDAHRAPLFNHFTPRHTRGGSGTSLGPPAPP
jgi:hypothetical protein